MRGSRLAMLVSYQLRRENYTGFRCGIWTEHSGGERSRAWSASSRVVASVGGWLLLRSPSSSSQSTTTAASARLAILPRRRRTGRPTDSTRRRTRYLPSDQVRPPYKLAWSYDAGHLMEYSPIVVGETLYGIDNNGEAFALNTPERQAALAPRRRHLERLGSDLQQRPPLHLQPRAGPGAGAERPERQGRLAPSLPGRTESSPLVVGNEVIAGCECGSVYALNAQTGKELWSTAVGGAVKASPAYDNGNGLRRRLQRADDRAPSEQRADWSGRRAPATASTAPPRSPSAGSTPATSAAASTPGTSRPAARTGAPRPAATSTAARRPRRRRTRRRASTSAPTTGPSTRSTPGPARTRWSESASGPVSGAGSMIGDVFYAGDLKTTQTWGFRATDGKPVFQSRDGAYNPVISDGRRALHDRLPDDLLAAAGPPAARPTALSRRAATLRAELAPRLPPRDALVEVVGRDAGERRDDAGRGPRPGAGADQAAQGVGGEADVGRPALGRRADHDDDLAAGLVAEPAGELAEGAARDLLVELGELAADRRRPVGGELGERPQRLGQAPRATRRRSGSRSTAGRARARRSGAGRKPWKRKRCGRQPGGDQRGDDRRGPRKHLDVEVAVDAGPDQAVARVGDRRACPRRRRARRCRRARSAGPARGRARPRSPRGRRPAAAPGSRAARAAARSCRVSSQAITSASWSARRTRSVMSSRFPIGVGQTVSLPGIGSALLVELDQRHRRGADHPRVRPQLGQLHRRLVHRRRARASAAPRAPGRAAGRRPPRHRRRSRSHRGRRCWRGSPGATPRWRPAVGHDLARQLVALDGAARSRSCRRSAPRRRALPSAESGSRSAAALPSRASAVPEA